MNKVYEETLREKNKTKLEFAQKIQQTLSLSHSNKNNMKNTSALDRIQEIDVTSWHDVNKWLHMLAWDQPF